jgi:glycosyltransferase involved in cell wall biosynthesis
MHNDLLFLTLRVFSATGGIEKVCRIAGKAFYENSIRNQQRFRIFSMHDGRDAAMDNPYFPSELFTGFGGHKTSFVQKAVLQGIQSRVVLLSHINLLLPAYLIKKMSPTTRIILLAHGIEIWGPISPRHQMMLSCCDEIVAVSQFTSDRIQEVHGIPASKCRVLNNCLDPFLPLPKNAVVSKAFYEKYHCSPDDRILFTLTRLAGTEHYKGYDKVLHAISQMPIPRLKYLLAGKYDAVEKAALDALILELGLKDTVLLPGFVPDADVALLFSMADVYVMPSLKEGFGIVFIEAMYYGLPVIAGNADGSVDALLNGALGLLVNPQSVLEVKVAIEKILNDPLHYQPDAALLNQHFSYEGYKERVEALLNG